MRRRRRIDRARVRTASRAWPVVSAVGVLGYGAWLRRRIARFEVLTDTDEPVAPGHTFVVAGGVDLDPATARAASSHARRHGLDVVDLVPADLPAERLLDLARRVDPRAFRDDPFALGIGAGCALLVTDDVRRRAGVDRHAPRDEVDLLQLARVLTRHAPLTTGHALAPHLRTPRQGLDEAWRREAIDVFFSITTPAALVGRAAVLIALGLAAARGGHGLALPIAHALQVPVAVAGTAARPRDLLARTAVRGPAAARDLGRIVRARDARRDGAGRRARERRVERAHAEASGRAAYGRDLAGGTAHLFEPRRADCPICGAADLRVRVRTADLQQCKPGTFTLVECGACGLVFQNPMLTPEGLGVYYRDFYDGLGEEQTERAFTSQRPFYRRRCAMVAAHAGPRRWLDVGGGHGHFCLTARRVWPEATFDALDQASSIEDAERRGWVDRAIRGAFPHRAADMADAYDVVSMHHYLEHTRDPGAELDAARTVLEPGGLLLIEMPDPDALAARLLGRWWCSYLQPQHLHMPPLPLLERLLADRGFTVVDRHRREANQGGDLTGAAYLAVNRLGPPVGVPWRPPSSAAARVRRTLALTAALPLLATATIVDRTVGALVGLGLPVSNAYRVLARLDEDPTR